MADTATLDHDTAEDRMAAADDGTTVHGDPEKGFIVERHDGDRHQVHGSMADSEDEARAEARRRWSQEDSDASEESDDHAGAKSVKRDDLNAAMSEHTDAMNAIKADIEARMEELDKRQSAMDERLSAQNDKFTKIHDALAQINKPAVEAAEPPPAKTDRRGSDKSA